jgi:hypothetical protein
MPFPRGLLHESRADPRIVVIDFQFVQDLRYLPPVVGVVGVELAKHKRQGHVGGVPAVPVKFHRGGKAGFGKGPDKVRQGLVRSFNVRSYLFPPGLVQGILRKADLFQNRQMRGRRVGTQGAAEKAGKEQGAAADMAGQAGEAVVI